MGTIAAIDRQSRALLELREVYVPADRARAALARPPDLESPRLISWGALTREESLRLVDCEEDESFRADFMRELEALFAQPPSATFTLFYCDARRGG